MTDGLSRRRLLLLAGAAVVPGLAACGSDERRSVGELLPASPAGSASASASASPSASVPPPPPEPSPSATRLTGGGTFVLDAGDVVATLRLPADAEQEDVVDLKTFLRRTHSPELLIASVTVTNRSPAPFSVVGFQVQGPSGEIPLYSVATFVNLAMARPGVSGSADRVMEGAVVSLTSVTAVAPGAEVTTLVATQSAVGQVTGVVHRPAGGSGAPLKPLWQIRQEAARLARQHEKEARQLARRQASEARRRARQKGAGGA